MLMNQNQRISAFAELGATLTQLLDNVENIVGQGDTTESDFRHLLRSAQLQNPWFIPENTVFALRQWAELLTKSRLSSWIEPYQSQLEKQLVSKRVGVVNAGNIPLVGFHDFLSVLICGHSYLGKNASDDALLLPFIAGLLQKIEPRFKSLISFTDRLAEFDAVIATGSNNTARYFEHYFGKVPNIIRKNRNGVAVLKGNETAAQFKLLGEDIFRYFGLGCRNISKLYVPEKYDFSLFFESMMSFQDVMSHNKYMNNFEYHNTVYLLKTIPFLQNGFMILKEDVSIPSPIAVVHYEKYSDENLLRQQFINDREKLQCIVVEDKELFSGSGLEPILTDFGKTQHPGLSDYADGVDTVGFLSVI